MFDATASHLHLLKVLNAAMCPSKIASIVEEWPSLRETGISIKGCEVRKVRPTKGGALELEYRIKLVKSGTAGKFTATVLGNIYQDEKGEQEYKKVLESLKGKGPPFADASLQGFAVYIPEFRLLLRSPSTDEELPSLQVALDLEGIRPFLGGYLTTSLHGSKSISRCEVDILRYRPGKRCTLRYRLEAVNPHAGQIHRQSFIGKIYGNREEGQSVFTIMLELYRKGFGSDSSDGMKIPHPLGYIRELHMVLMEDVPSPPISKSFSSPRLVDHLKGAARALVKIHACPVRTARTYHPEDEVSSLKRWVSKAIWVNPDLTGPFETCLSAIIRLAHDLQGREPVLIHGDFWHNQVLVGSNGVTILDFDTFCNGDPARDLGNFLAHLRAKASERSWTEGEAGGYGRTFLAAYGRCTHPEMMARIDFYHRMSLLRLACVFSLRPRRWHLTAPLLAEAGKAHSF